MKKQDFQVVIHIVDKPLEFKTAGDFMKYYESQRQQGGMDEVGMPVWKKFEHLPMLKVVDRRDDSGFEVDFIDKLPDKTVVNGEGEPLIVIA